MAAYKMIVRRHTVPIDKPITYPANAWKAPTLESIDGAPDYVSMLWYEMIRVEEEAPNGR